MSVYRPLIALVLLHALVDACAILVGPLWGKLKTEHGLSETTLFIVLTVQALSPSLSQVVFGYLRDRFVIRHVLWIGPLVAALCMSFVGVASNVTALCLILVVGGTGIGAFHPEAAVVAGGVLPGQRTRGLSLFMFGGAVGLGVGPILSGVIVDSQGLIGLLWLGVPIALAIVGLVWWGRLQRQTPGELELSANIRRSDAPAIGLVQMLEGRGRLALLILAVCSFRLVPNMAMDKILAFTLTEQQAGAASIGLTQSLFLASASAGMLLMAYRFRTGWEKAFMIWCPILGIPLLYALGATSDRSTIHWLLIPTGLVLWGTTPVMVSYAHQQFPKGAGLASALTMGLAWGVGGMIQAKITSAYVTDGVAQQAFHAFIPCLALSAAGACLLPAVANRNDPTEDEPADTSESDSAEATASSLEAIKPTV